MLVGLPAAIAAPLSIDEPLRTGAAAPHDVAVVIGNEDYGFMADVAFARRDAQAFHDFLLYTRGVPADRIRLLTDKPKEVIAKAVADLAAQVPADGTFWLFFAGHGAAHPETGARLLLGNDVQRDVDVFVGRGVELAGLQADAARSGAQVVAVIDACFNGAGRDGALLVEGKRFAVPAYAVQPGSRVSEWSATGPEQLAGPLEETRHGAFSYFVVGAMRGWADGELDGKADGTVTLAEGQAYVARSLRAAQVVEQTPVLVGSADVVLARGELERGPPAVADVATPPPPLPDAPAPAPVTRWCSTRGSIRTAQSPRSSAASTSRAPGARPTRSGRPSAGRLPWSWTSATRWTLAP